MFFKLEGSQWSGHEPPRWQCWLGEGREESVHWVYPERVCRIQAQFDCENPGSAWSDILWPIRKVTGPNGPLYLQVKQKELSRQACQGENLYSSLSSTSLGREASQVTLCRNFSIGSTAGRDRWTSFLCRRIGSSIRLCKHAVFISDLMWSWFFGLEFTDLMRLLLPASCWCLFCVSPYCWEIKSDLPELTLQCGWVYNVTTASCDLSVNVFQLTLIYIDLSIVLTSDHIVLQHQQA